MTTLQEKLHNLRESQTAAKTIRAKFKLDDPFYDPDFRGMSATQIAEMILAEIGKGTEHWYRDAGITRDDAVSYLGQIVR